MKELHSLEEAFEYAGALIDGTEEFNGVCFNGDFSYTITMKGESWHGFVDKRHAKYLLTLQDTVDDVLADVFGKNFDVKKDVNVRIQVSEGSSKISNDIFDILASVADKMTGGQIFVAVMSAIVLWAGYHFYKTYTSSEVEKKKSEDETNRISMLTKLVEKAMGSKENIMVSEKPIKSLYNSMNDNDSMSVVNEEIVLDKAQVRKSLQSSTRSRPQISYCDDEYDLEDINFSQGEQVLFLSRDGIRFKALTSMLSDIENEKLDKMISEKKLTESMPFSLPLQLNVEHTSKTIRVATIIGVGTKRENVEIKNINELLD